jgi:hypothetical protein
MGSARCAEGAIMSIDDNGIPVVPKRRKREVPLEEQLDAPELQRPDDEPTVSGCLLTQGPSGGWMLIDVEIPESHVARYSTKVRDGEIAGIACAQAEARMLSIVERGAPGVVRTRSGTLTPASARERLAEAVAELHREYWGDTRLPDEASRALHEFVRTGRVVTDLRKPTGDDRQRLQRLVEAMGGGWL